MKPTIKVIFSLMLITCALLFIACENPDVEEEGGMGGFTISFSGVQRTEGSRASVYPPSDSPQGNTDPKAPALSELNFKVTFTDIYSKEEKTFNFRGDQEIKGNIATGMYFVTVEVSLLDGAPYALGGSIAGVEIKSGSNNPIRVWLDYKEPVVSMAVITPPSGPSYQGCFPDLTGMVVEFTYTDGYTSLETDFSSPRFSIEAPGANSSGFSRIVEQATTPQTIVFTYMSINGFAFSPTVNIEVVPLVNVYVTTKGALDMFEEVAYPDFGNAIVEGFYSDGWYRPIPLQMLREDNWFESNSYYLNPDSTPRTLIDKRNKIISYRVASNNADLPTFTQSIGVDPRTTVGSEIFAEIPFDNYFQIENITVLDVPVTLTGKTYPPGTDPSTIDWVNELHGSNFMLTVDYVPVSRLVDISNFTYAASRGMAELTVSASFSSIRITYFSRRVTVPLNVVP